jgi:hypothetical protein
LPLLNIDAWSAFAIVVYAIVAGVHAEGDEGNVPVAFEGNYPPNVSSQWIFWERMKERWRAWFNDITLYKNGTLDLTRMD